MIDESLIVIKIQEIQNQLITNLYLWLQNVQVFFKIK